jgi:hypothetical protein
MFSRLYEEFNIETGESKIEKVNGFWLDLSKK